MPLRQFYFSASSPSRSTFALLIFTCTLLTTAFSIGTTRYRRRAALTGSRSNAPPALKYGARPLMVAVALFRSTLMLTERTSAPPMVRQNLIAAMLGLFSSFTIFLAVSAAMPRMLYAANINIRCDIIAYVVKECRRNFYALARSMSRYLSAAESVVFSY